VVAKRVSPRDLRSNGVIPEAGAKKASGESLPAVNESVTDRRRGIAIVQADESRSCRPRNGLVRDRRASSIQPHDTSSKRTSGPECPITLASFLDSLSPSGWKSCCLWFATPNLLGNSRPDFLFQRRFPGTAGCVRWWSDSRTRARQTPVRPDIAFHHARAMSECGCQRHGDRPWL
jgi:hypothetical protein